MPLSGTAPAHGAREIVVIGAGIVGVCCTLSLLEEGFKVTLVDSMPPGHGASDGNAGVISPWSFVPQSLPGLWRQLPGWLLEREGPLQLRWRDLPVIAPWALEFFKHGTPVSVQHSSRAMSELVFGTVESYRHLLRGTDSHHLLRDSWYLNVYHGKAKPDLADLPWKLRLDSGAPITLVNGDELRKIEPALSGDCHSAVVIRDQARACSPGELCRALAQKAASEGATITQAHVKSIRPGHHGGVSLDLGDETLHVPRAVLCTGAHSAQLLRRFGLALPLMAERGYHLQFTNPGITLNHSIMDVAGKFVVSSMPDGIRAAGTAEFASLDAAPDYRRARVFKTLTQRLLPGMKAEDSREWMGTRPSFPDSLPAIGPVPRIPGLFAAFGHSHYGMSMAPTTGRLIATLVSGRTPNINMEAYRVDRFERS